jgi:hypothetical protein
MERKSVAPADARAIILTRTTALATLLLHRGDVDGMICGVNGGFHRHLNYVRNVIGLAPGLTDFSAINLLITPRGTIFITDTYVTDNPSAEHIAQTTLMAADVVRRFGLTPKAALLSHSNFGSSSAPSAQKMRDALQILFERERCTLTPRSPRRYASGFSPTPGSRAAPTCWSCRTWTRPRCTLTPRSPRRYASGFSPTPGSRAAPTCWSCRTWTRPISLST